MHQALYCQTRDDDRILCKLCPQSCVIAPDQSGLCGTRTNQDNTLFAINYAQISGLSMDPIEKKPLYHFYPGQEILSAGTLGCNFHCRFCQNHTISQYYKQEQQPPVLNISPDALVNKALSQSSFGIAYTYSEPVVWYEYVLDTSRLAHQQGLKNVLVSNGFINPQPLKELLPYIDAANIDLKAFTNDHYRALGGNIETIKENIRTIYESGTHLELTTLIVTDFNNKPEELEQLFQWIGNISEDIPLHLSRYHPCYQSTAPATDPAFITKMATLAQSYLHYVYVGNMPGNQDSHCPTCNNTLIQRQAFHTKLVGIKRVKNISRCTQCQKELNFILDEA